MENYKIYVHHNYSYERFWYFFHGVDVDIDDVVTHTNTDNAFNKNIPITDKINIKFSYKNNPIDVYFVGDSDWNLDGHHIFDYSINLYDEKLASDRGFNSNIMERIDNSIIPHLNEVSSKYVDNKYHFIYITWEGHHGYTQHNMKTQLNKNVNVYVDDYPLYVKEENCLYPFTTNIMSFIYPNTLGLREFYFMSKFLKNRKYKHKLNFPIRRLYGNKIKLYNKIKKCKNINVTHSSFHDTKQYSNDQVGGFRNFLIKQIGSENIIQKRGYGIHDWGGEWNDDNVKEMMYRLYDIADVNIIPEYSIAEAISKIHHEPSSKIYMVGTSYITEKSISHILIEKPFIPISFETIEFYEKMMDENQKEYRKYPLKYKKLVDIIHEIDEIASDETQWNKLLQDLKNWVHDIRKNIIDIVNTKNDILETIIHNKKTSITKNLL